LPKSRVLGAEFDLTAAVTERLSLNASAGFLDTKMLSGSANGIDLRGNRLSYAPSFSMSAGFVYSLPLGGWGVADLHGDLWHSSSQFYQIDNDPKNREPEYTIYNARIRLHPEDDRFGVSFYMKNITDKLYRTVRLSLPSLGYTYANINNPRTYGVSVDVKF